jgi:hypothetical protein
MLLMLHVGLPRLAALCLCRLWDAPGTDRHSLLALTKIISFAKIAGERDPSFIRDCRRFSHRELIFELVQFRNTDLAHNLSLPAKGKGLTVEKLRQVLLETQTMVDRVVSILEISEIAQNESYQLMKQYPQGFWTLITPVIKKKSSK